MKKVGQTKHKRRHYVTDVWAHLKRRQKKNRSCRPHFDQRVPPDGTTRAHTADGNIKSRAECPSKLYVILINVL